MRRMQRNALGSSMRLTDLPRPKWWGFWVRLFKTVDVLIFKLLEIFKVYRPVKSIMGIPTLSTPTMTSVQAVVYNGTIEEVLGFKPRRLLHKILRGVPDVEFFERVEFQVPISGTDVRMVQASTETRGFIHLQLPWSTPQETYSVSSLGMTPKGVETLVGRISIGEYEIVPGPVFFLNDKIKWIVFSDIDDTIKDSKVGESTTFRQIVGGLFRGNYYTYDAIGGMAELYQRLVTRGAMIVYVTSTPYQLTPFLLKFLKEQRFPEGPVFPRWIGYGRFGHKWRTLSRIIGAMGGQKCLLIGDSGELDLQIYRRLYETPTFQSKIARVMIRHIPGTPVLEKRNDAEFFYDEIPEIVKEVESLII